MTEPSHRRWFQFSLRKLLLVVTLFAMVLGFRVACLRYVADYHRKEAESRLAWLRRTDRSPQEEEDYNSYKGWLNWHIRWRDAYDKAVYQPWKLVEEKHSPEEMP
ncbi:MAG: hypothetical protein IAF94_13950 [Pirellulaceae bacterium]|nr:hypothetical protein [Pirellulaceae bacterium]